MILASADWTPIQAEFDAFARLSGDDNPIHVDPAFAARTRFGRTVSHGMLIYARLWALLVQVCPDGAPVHHALMFPAPAYPNEPLHLEVRQTPEGHLAMTATRRIDGVIVLQGLAEGGAA
jgi:acyl dehydratase